MKILIKNGRLTDPASRTDSVRDILTDSGIIEKIGRDINDSAEYTVDARGMWVVPGLIDMHVHFRDPGYLYKEDIFTGSAAAAAGGFTSVLTMPNTNPAVDCAETVSYICRKAEQVGFINVFVCGSVTKNQAGLTLSDISGMAEAGIKALSEDGKSVENPTLLKKALEECKKLGIPMLSHCEDAKLSANGVMNDGARAKLLGLSGIPASSEVSIVARDIALASEIGAALHICHVSAKDSVELIRAAKKKGVNVTAEAAPHHFILSEDVLDGKDTNFKMNPPLRGRDDVEAVIQGIADGTIDCIATDHAPHSSDEKNGTFKDAPNGIVGLETSLPLCVTYLVKTKILTPLELIEKMSLNPSKILKLNGGHISVGGPADITVFDPDAEFIIDPAAFKSKSKNTPFGGFKVSGKARCTIKGGRIVFKD